MRGQIGFVLLLIGVAGLDSSGVWFWVAMAMAAAGLSLIVRGERR